MYNNVFWTLSFVFCTLLTFFCTYIISAYYQDISRHDFTLSQSMNKSKVGSTIAMRVGQIGLFFTAITLLLMEFTRNDSKHFKKRMTCSIIISILMVAVAFTPLATSEQRHFRLASMFFVAIACYTLMYAMITKNPIIICLMLTQFLTLGCMVYSKYIQNALAFSISELVTCCLMLVLLIVLINPGLMDGAEKLKQWRLPRGVFR